jgi:hypothetical protein
MYQGAAGGPGDGNGGGGGPETPEPGAEGPAGGKAKKDGGVIDAEFEETQ